ncbi:MAG: Fic family protein [Gaiellaceae bacterium]
MDSGDSASARSAGLALPDRPTYVTRRWEPGPHLMGGRRARQSFGYQAYVPQAIADLDPPLSSRLVEDLIAAERSCRELNDDPPVAGNLEALARQLLRTEAVASSRIEGLVVSHRKLARALVEPGRHDTASEVVANVRAAERAIELASTSPAISPETLLEVHRILFTGTRSERFAGIIRREQNWIGGRQPNPSDAEFIPPPEEYVEAALEDLVAFVNRDDLPAALQAAIAHAQFETIHPFPDGNGRVGRALIHAVLRRRGVAPRYVPPISLVLAGRADAYVAGLTAYRQGAENDWYELFADTLETASHLARGLAQRVAVLQQQWFEQAGRPRPQSGAKKLIDAMPGYPVVDARTAQEITGSASRETARTAIIRLTEAGVLRELSTGRSRNRLWESVGLFDLLDSFERDLMPANHAPRDTH